MEHHSEKLESSVGMYGGGQNLSQPPLIAYKRDTNTHDMLVGSELQPTITQQEPLRVIRISVKRALSTVPL